jgi:hypothetical protein
VRRSQQPSGRHHGGGGHHLQQAREKLAVDLDPVPSLDRWPPLTSGQEGGKCSFLVIGSSHAGKLGAALTRKGHRVYEAN